MNLRATSREIIMVFYDLDQIRAIPLLDIARRLELPLDDAGHTDCLVHWGAPQSGYRSCSLTEPDNYFRCPCGNSGWATDLVSQARRCDVVDAAQWLGQEFELPPCRTPAKTDYISRSRGIRPPSSS